ncbi:repulsive guidance molecule A-like [Tubulanus polymorphus]|uniref:repulsive guidance molecule A-like n=1 Tax=Tubulanus polymorphus TaxID=672921 RepID=UPI003DA44BB9
MELKTNHVNHERTNVRSRRYEINEDSRRNGGGGGSHEKHVWQGGMWSPGASVNRSTTSSSILFVTILFGFLSISSVRSQCLVDMCWLQYKEALGFMEVNVNSEVQCTAFRTYYYCLRNMTRNCFGNIKYHSVKKVVESGMKNHNCTQEGPVYKQAGQGADDGKNITPHRPVRPPPRPNRICGYKGRLVHQHCGLFGDPHIRTFNGDYQTCKVAGAWPLVDNKYVTVQVTNEPVLKTDGPTATNKVTVIVKSNRMCGSDVFTMYQAQNDANLPTTFDNGRSHYGPDRTVTITQIVPGTHVEIYIRYIDTTISIRQVGRYLTVAIKMPEDIVNSSTRPIPYGLQLCARGCPAGERINYQEFLARKKTRVDSIMRRNELAMSRERAVKLCKAAKTTDFYFDSCVFDLMVTGDENFTLAAAIALQDMLQMFPEFRKSNRNRTDFARYDMLYGDGSRTTAFSSVIAFLVLIVVYLNSPLAASAR